MYKIRHITSQEIPQFVKYSEKAFPERGKEEKRIIDFWLARRENAFEDFVCVEKDGEFYGEVLFSAMSAYYRGEYEEAHWTFDLIVDKELRKDVVGLDLVRTPVKDYPNLYCTGSGPLAVKINLKMGRMLLGDIRKYVKIINPFRFFTAAFRGKIPAEKFPKTIENVWQKVENVEQLPDIPQPYNSDILEIGRDKEYMKWRFFSDFHPYAMYKNTTNNDYFVVTTTVQKHLTAIVLVDFRCSLKDSEGFRDIVKATHKLANKLFLPISICGSSHTTLDGVLENNGYMSIGRPRPIMGKKKKFKTEKEAIEARSFTLVTLADSDGEVYW